VELQMLLKATKVASQPEPKERETFALPMQPRASASWKLLQETRSVCRKRSITDLIAIEVETNQHTKVVALPSVEQHQMTTTTPSRIIMIGAKLAKGAISRHGSRSPDWMVDEPLAMQPPGSFTA